MKTILICAVVSLITSILCTPLVVAFFRRRGFGQEIRVDGPQSHLVKRGTPTMGGVAIIGSTSVLISYSTCQALAVVTAWRRLTGSWNNMPAMPSFSIALALPIMTC